jgi:ABC-type transporter Mla subunit MlaD
MTAVTRPEGASAQVAGLVDDAQKLASTAATEAQEAARRLAEQQKSVAAERVDEVARVLDKAADSFEKVLPQAAHYAREAASGVRGASSTIRQQSIEDLYEGLKAFARGRPVVFFGASLVAGLALARFLKSSADQRLQAAGAGTSAQGSQPQRPGRAPGRGGH